MERFGIPLELTSGLMVMWGARNSCTYSLKNDRDLFRIDSAKRCHNYGLKSLWYLKQEHTAVGNVVADLSVSGVQLLDDEADFLITNLSYVGVGVITADCLPIVIYDPVQRVVAVVHAGWKGTVQGIAIVALRRMQQEYGSRLEDVTIWFGPHAHVCCYQVSQDFSQNLFQEFVVDAIQVRGDSFFFNNMQYTKLLLQMHGVKDHQLQYQYSVCTMCTPGFHSRRNDGPLYVGQSTIAWIAS